MGVVNPSGPTGAGVDGSPGPLPREIVAEASVWVARLHGPDRSPQMERECLAWQARSALHRLAFERVTDTWQDVAGISVTDAYRAVHGTNEARPGKVLRSRAGWGVALAACVLATVALTLWWPLNADDLRTAVGEQRMVTLDDGTRISLNTDTRVTVEMGTGRRTVDVGQGEALFEVAKDPKRPFVVRAGGSEVEAVGTVFSVRYGVGQGAGERALSVALVEGQVNVRAAPGSAAPANSSAAVIAMKPGERIRLVQPASTGSATAAVSPAQIDWPRMDQVLAWRHNEAVFDDVALADAVAEMNRYSRTQLVLLDKAALPGLRVSGQFRTGDSARFAQAVAAVHGLVIHERDGRLELEKPQ